MSNAHGEDLVVQARDNYVSQFLAFVHEQRARCVTGASEVKFELGADSPAFHRLSVVDFVRNDDGPEAILFEPDSYLTFDRIEGRIAETELVLDGLRWDALLIRHDVPDIDDAIEAWFAKWFDPDELRFEHANELSSCIHAVYTGTNELEVDLGTAPPEAFWELLTCLAEANATSLHVRS